MHHVPLPRRATVELGSASFAEVQPPEYAAELVLQWSAGRRRLALIVEVQLDASRQRRLEKRNAWPRYVAWQWREPDHPAWLVVVTPSRSVERWASKPVELAATIRESISACMRGTLSTPLCPLSRYRGFNTVAVG